MAEISVNITELTKALTPASPDLAGLDIAEALWLAQFMEFVPNKVRIKRPEPELLRLDNNIIPAISEKTDVKRGKEERDKNKSNSVPLYSESVQSEGNVRQGGKAIRIPGVRMLQDRLLLERSLRPFRRDVLSQQHFVLDEAATVEASAEQNIITPILKGSSERWLDAEFVVDCGLSMRVWRETLKELLQIFKSSGVYSDVRVWYLFTDDKEKPYLTANPDPTSRHCNQKELYKPSKQQLLLLITDCASKAWFSGLVVERYLRHWQENMLVSIVQMLPQRMWMGTALRNSEATNFSSSHGVTSNKNLFHDDYWVEVDKEEVSSQYPVVTIDPISFDALARVIMGGQECWVSGVIIKKSDFPIQQQKGSEELKAEERISHFRRQASPTARKLVEYFACIPLTLPVMRLIQHSVLPKSNQTHLAEFLLSGLVKIVESSEDFVEYEFYDQVREQLQNLLPLSEIKDTFNKASQYISENQGVTIDFRGMVPALDGDDYSFHSESFARLSLEILNRLPARKISNSSGKNKQNISVENVRSSEDEANSNKVGDSTDSLSSEKKFSGLFRESWPIDGKDHHDVNENGLYHNAKIESFLRSEKHTLIISAKGLGRTLLLRAKKNILEKENNGCIIIPLNQEYDYPEIRWPLDPGGLADINLWEGVWFFSFVFSALSSNKIKDIEYFKLSIDKLTVNSDFRSELLDDAIKNRAREPSHYLVEILQLTITEMYQFFNSSNVVREMSNHFVISSVCIFIDAFDQTLTERFSGDLKIWSKAQIGLLKAAVEVRHSNKLIKVFSGIRQEAWASYNEDDRLLIEEQVLVLSYSKQELKDMFLHAIKKYTPYNSIEEFVGLETIRSTLIGKEEELFDYILRHSVGTPRSVMALGHTLSRANLHDLHGEARRDHFRHLINEDGAEHLYADYLLSQRRIFLNVLGSNERVKTLLKLVPTNVLPGKSLGNITKQFAAEFSLFFEDTHPFCELLNIGILGVVKRDPVTNKKIQYFRKPQDFDWKMQNLISDDDIYLIHPSLHNSILQNRTDHYYQNPVNLIGDGLEWVDLPRTFPQVHIAYSQPDKEKLEPVINKLVKHLDLRMPCAFWHDHDGTPLEVDNIQEVKMEASKSDIVLVFLTQRCLDLGWFTQEWSQEYNNNISQSTTQVIYCSLDNVPFSGFPGWPDLIGDKPFIDLSGFETESEEPISTLVSQIELCLKTFWTVGDWKAQWLI